jgi:hypothetical protein
LKKLKRRLKEHLGKAVRYIVQLRTPHEKQRVFIRSRAKRKILRAGRRWGKTVTAANIAVPMFLAGKRVLYAAPTDEQLATFWNEVKRLLAELIEDGLFIKNESEHTIERAGTNQRIKAKTAWNADTLRGDYADLLILDEFQLMAEETWEEVGAPMLLDSGGDAVFIYTPLSLHSRSGSRARDPRHASKMFAKAAEHMKVRAAAGLPLIWEAFHFTSHDNPHISKAALQEVSRDMTTLAYRQEILAEDLHDAPGALWTREMIERSRVEQHPALLRVAVGVDPPGGLTDCGIVVAGIAYCSCNGSKELHAFVLGDRSLKGSPDAWAKAVVAAYRFFKADRVYGEANFGGDMVRATIRTADPSVAFHEVHASRGKAVRAEPVSALYEQGRIHHLGSLQELEEEMVSWIPGTSPWSPNRTDALVWALTELMPKQPAHYAVPTLVSAGPSYWSRM